MYFLMFYLHSDLFTDILTQATFEFIRHFLNEQQQYVYCERTVTITPIVMSKLV